MSTDHDNLKIIPERDEMVPARKPVQTQSNGPLWGAVVLLFAGVAGLGYQNMELTKQLQAQNDAIVKQVSEQLTPVTEKLTAQARMLSQTGEKTEGRLVALENALAATGKDLSASGSALEKRVKDSEHEIRKLWDLSNKRNKVDIAQQKKRLEAQKKELAELNGTLKQLETDLKDSSGKAEQSLAQLKADTQSQKNNVSSLKAQLTETDINISAVKAVQADYKKDAKSLRTQLSGLNERLDLLKGALSVIQKEQKGLTGQKQQLSKLERQMIKLDNHDQTEVKIRLDEYAERLDAIDAARRQLTTNITRLNTDVNRIQLTLKSMKAK